MNELPIFDERVHSVLSAELGAEDTTEVMQMFLDDTSRKIVAICGDATSRSAVKREAHSIKSSAATFGFVRLSQLARDLEAGAETMESGLLSNSIAVLQSTFRETSAFARSTLLATSVESAQ